MFQKFNSYINLPIIQCPRACHVISITYRNSEFTQAYINTSAKFRKPESNSIKFRLPALTAVHSVAPLSGTYHLMSESDIWTVLILKIGKVMDSPFNSICINILIMCWDTTAVICIASQKDILYMDSGLKGRIRSRPASKWI